MKLLKTTGALRRDVVKWNKLVQNVFRHREVEGMRVKDEIVKSSLTMGQIVMVKVDYFGNVGARSANTKIAQSA